MYSFIPPQRTLLGPGPCNVSDRVLEAMARPTIGHLDSAFVGMMDEIRSLLRFAFKTENRMTFPISGPGSAGMECCFVNLVEPGDTVIVCKNGVFGGRMEENVIRCGGVAVTVDNDWGQPVDVAKAEAALKAHPGAKIVAFVQAETSTGARSDAAELCRLAQEHDCLTIVDTVTSLGGIEVSIDEWGADAVYSGSQKCLASPPGLSPVTFSPKAVEVVANRRTKVQSWFLDLNLLMGYWQAEGGRSYHHTAPINLLYALHESLLMLKEEGLEAAWSRYESNYELLRAGLESMGLSVPVTRGDHLPELVTVTVPDGVDEAEIRTRMLEDHGIEIGAGLGQLAGKVWRIGLMGQNSSPETVRLCLDALKASMRDAETA